MIAIIGKVLALTLAAGFILSNNLYSPVFPASADTSYQQKSPTQQQAGQEKEDPAVKLGTDLVLLDVTVIDTSNNTAVMNLARKDFQVLEDKVPQDIQFFSKDEVPVSIAFTIDTSGSMRSKLDTVVKAAVSLVKQSRRGDECAVIEFKEAPELLQEFTYNMTDVIDTLEDLVARSSTSMLDAVYLSADYARKESHNRRRALVVVTDGLDKENYYKFDDVVKQLQESDVQIYMIGFTQDLDNGFGVFTKSSKSKAESLLNKLAVETGGRAFFPKSLSDVQAIAQQISTDLRTQYTIGYYPSNAKRDGAFHKIKVQVNSGTNRLVARTRTGYYAPTDNPKTPKT